MGKTYTHLLSFSTLPVKPSDLIILTLIGVGVKILDFWWDKSMGGGVGVKWERERRKKEWQRWGIEPKPVNSLPHFPSMRKRSHHQEDNCAHVAAATTGKSDSHLCRGGKSGCRRGSRAGCGWCGSSRGLRPGARHRLCGGGVAGSFDRCTWSWFLSRRFHPFDSLLLTNSTIRTRGSVSKANILSFIVRTKHAQIKSRDNHTQRLKVQVVE